MTHVLLQPNYSLQVQSLYRSLPLTSARPDFEMVIVVCTCQKYFIRYFRFMRKFHLLQYFLIVFSTLKLSISFFHTKGQKNNQQTSVWFQILYLEILMDSYIPTKGTTDKARSAAPLFLSQRSNSIHRAVRSTQIYLYRNIIL